MNEFFLTAPLLASAGWAVLNLLLFAVFPGIPLLLLAAGVYYLLSLPGRRAERAQLFLHVVESRLADGRPLEPALLSLAESRDLTLGHKFHLLAAYLEEGERLAVAVEKSGLLPRAVAAMFTAGLELGDVRKVLPACRQVLRDTQSGMSGALNYLMVLVAGLAPVVVFLLWFTLIVVAPKIEEVFAGLSEDGPRTFWLDVLQVSLHAAVGVQTGLLAVLLVAAVLYLGGPGLPRWLWRLTHPFADLFAWCVPWKRRRMQRNFAAMLATLLDHGVPEAVALRLAGDCAGNSRFARRARRAAERLAAGEPLTKAVAVVDDAGEFRWRLTNAVTARGGFSTALRGWFEALDAKAFQQEQAAAHLITTAFVVLNGAAIGCVCAGLFGALISIMEVAGS
jgi:type II secretory pathway component PulF